MIQIKNCNNIDEADIIINENCLNIKYAINWTWKSTIAKAIKYHVNNKDGLKNLTPFKYRKSDIEPEVIWVDKFKKVMIFDEEYINQHTFQHTEILKNSFEIFIKNDKYDEWLKEINKLTENTRNAFQDNEIINKFISDLESFIKFYWTSQKPSRAWDLVKGLWSWNKIQNIPLWLESYSDYITNSNNVNWLSWQLNWKNFLNIKEDNCPYCISWIKEKKEIILKVSEEYDSKTVEKLKKVLDVIDWLYTYFPESVQKIIDYIKNNIWWFTWDDNDYLEKIKAEAEKLKYKLLKIKNINFFHFKDVEEIEIEIKELKINLDRYDYFISDYSKEQIKLIDEELDKLFLNIWKLIWAINKQKDLVKKTIDKYKIEMNYFLQSAWYKYKIDSIEDGETYKLILIHDDNAESLNWKEHLSFWERNALSLVLFMYQSLSEKADFIIFDDPISSFDKNKKFAILNMFFNGYRINDPVRWLIQWETLRWKTILMLTHDFDPVIDIIHNNLKNLDLEWKTAHFLENKSWIINEKEIKKENIKSFWNILRENIKIDNLINIVYLRRFYEIDNNKDLEYQLLSSLIHKRKIPNKKIWKWEYEDLTEDEIQHATGKIRDFLSDFDYFEYLKKITDLEFMLDLYKKSNSNYEKLQIYRIINDWKDHENVVIMKFINETFHIENDYLFQLNPREYELIPNYVIEECNKELSKNTSN